jgi:5-methylcytosine-specific restriction endonuclease McrA
MGSKHKTKLCKCPLHRNGGAGVILPQTKFKRHGSDGVQGMCAEGKTLIDSYSHMLKRLQLLAVVDKKEAFNLLSQAGPQFKILTDRIYEIIELTLATPNSDNLNPSEYKLFLLTELDKTLKTEKSGFYDAPISPDTKIAFNEYLKTAFTPDRLDLMEEAQSNWTEGCYILDSKDGKLYPIEDFVFNVSKKRELYDKDGVLTPYRVNIHNTRTKGSRSSTLRGERYLADGEYTEANRHMKLLGNSDKNIHADHIVPLALGGIHDVRNLQPLNGKENIYKKDKLLPYALEMLKKDITYLSHWHHDAFVSVKDEPIEIIQEKLKSSVDSLLKKVLDLAEHEKFDFISKVYPTYKDSQVDRIIRKHFSDTND